MTRRVALVGAAGTGKTTLARELALQPGVRVVASPGEAERVLLLGLDLPGSEARAAEDAALRSALQQAGIAYQVIYGLGPRRLQSALAALGRADHPASATRPWNRACEKCSDPECEHRLFRRLLGQPDDAPRS